MLLLIINSDAQNLMSALVPTRFPYLLNQPHDKIRIHHPCPVCKMPRHARRQLQKLSVCTCMLCFRLPPTYLLRTMSATIFLGATLPDAPLRNARHAASLCRKPRRHCAQDIPRLHASLDPGHGRNSRTVDPNGQRDNR